MTSTVKKLDDSTIELTVDLSKEDLTGFTVEAEDKLNQGLHIKGFRLGRAPRGLSQRHISEDKIKSEAINLAISSSILKEVSEKKLQVFSQEDLKIKESSASRLVFSVVLSVFPEIKLPQYKGLVIKRKEPRVEELEVEQTLKEILESRAQLTNIEREARTGDVVEVDFVVKLDGKVVEGGESHNHPVTLGESKFIPGFEDQIVGMKQGDMKMFFLTAPGNYYKKELAGKNLEFEVTVKLVQEKKLPKLNESFVASLGNFASVQDFRDSIKETLILEKDNKERQRARAEVLEEIAKKVDIKIPNKLTEEKLDSMVREFDAELHQKGLELAFYLAQIKKTQGELRRDWRQRAEELVKTGLILQAVTREENITTTEEEIERELRFLISELSKNGGLDGIKDLDPVTTKERIKQALVNEKVLSFLENSNVIKVAN